MKRVENIYIKGRFTAYEGYEEPSEESISQALEGLSPDEIREKLSVDLIDELRERDGWDVLEDVFEGCNYGDEYPLNITVEYDDGTEEDFPDITPPIVDEGEEEISNYNLIYEYYSKYVVCEFISYEDIENFDPSKLSVHKKTYKTPHGDWKLATQFFYDGEPLQFNGVYDVDGDSIKWVNYYFTYKGETYEF